MIVFIKTLTGATISIDVSQADTVEQVKKLLQDREGIPAEQQQFIFNGRQLKDSMTLAEYNVQKGTIGKCSY